MKLVLCEDEEAFRSLLRRKLEMWGRKNGQALQLVLVSSAEELLFKREEWENADGLILDIELKAMNGMELARRVRESDRHIPILFVTGFEQYVFEGYEVGAVSYLMKPVNDAKLSQALERMLEQSRRRGDVLLVEGREGNTKVYQADIRYVESIGHYARVHTVQEVVESRQGISQIAARLDVSAFIATHRSFLANIPHISKITRRDVCMDNEERIPIARGRWEEVNRAYMAYFRPGK